MTIDINYWQKFYESHKNLSPSNFCESTVRDLKETQTILDCGCGSGRDTYHLASKGHMVTGIDSSTFIPKDSLNCTFIQGDFCGCDKDKYDVIYSRFSFHSIDHNNQRRFIESISKPGTVLYMEFRSDKDEFENHIHGDDHYRNYVSAEYVKDLINECGYDIITLVEDKGFAKYKTEDPYCIRLHAIKK